MRRSTGAGVPLADILTGASTKRSSTSMAELRLGRRMALMIGLACALPLAGCGGSKPRADPVREVRVISEANAFCRHVSALPPVSRRSQQQIMSIQARFAAFAREISKTAAYLPAGKDLNEAHAARRVLMSGAGKRSPAELALLVSPAFNKRVDRLQLRIYDDELALGLKCAGRIAAEAREMAHVIAASPN
jgi:hypothetical protein